MRSETTLRFDALEPRRMLYADMLSEAEVPDATSFSADIAVGANGEVLIAYVRGDDLMLRQYGPAGLSGPFTEERIPGADRPGSPRVAMNADGDYVVAWHQFALVDTVIGARGVTEIRYYTEGFNNEPSPLSGGGDTEDDGYRFGGFDSYYRYGRATLEPTLAEANMGINQRNPVVDIDRHGNFVIAWEESFSTPGYGVEQIFARAMEVSSDGYASWLSTGYDFGSYQDQVSFGPYGPGGGVYGASDPAIDISEEGNIYMAWVADFLAYPATGSVRVLAIGGQGDSVIDAVQNPVAATYDSSRMTTTQRLSSYGGLVAPDVAWMGNKAVLASHAVQADGTVDAGFEVFSASGASLNMGGEDSFEFQVSAGAGDFAAVRTVNKAGVFSVQTTVFETDGTVLFNESVAPGSATSFPRIDRKGSTYAVLWADTNGGLGARVYSVRARPNTDLNGDRLMDGVWQHGPSGTVVGTLYCPEFGDCGTRLLGGNFDWSVGAQGDFDGDGVSDFIWLQESTGLAVLNLLNADGSTRVSKVTGRSTDWGLDASGDYDGDGVTDIVWRHFASGINVMWLMDGENMPVQYAIGGDANWRLVATDHDFDVNADGKTDLMWRNAPTGVNIIKQMNGPNELSATVLPGGGSDWEIAATGDYDGDGYSDVLWRQVSTGTVLQWRLVNAVFQESTWIGGNLNWSVVGSEDADGDGRSDLFWREAATGVTVLRQANGASRILGGDRDWSLQRRPGRQVG